MKKIKMTSNKIITFYVTTMWKLIKIKQQSFLTYRSKKNNVQFIKYNFKQI